MGLALLVVAPQEVLMKTNKNIALSARKFRTTILICALAAVVGTVGCSSNSKPSAKSQPTARAKVQPAALKSVAAAEPALAIDLPEKTVVAKPTPGKLITYKSRDYGVSFVYPYQYAYLSAKVISNGDSSLLPKADGHDGQFTLARVEIPRGFYPDTDFDRGYFTLSLNQDISEDECIATLGADSTKLQTEDINGVDFRWMETDESGRGSSAKLRNYAAFANGTCYELEMGVKTKNEQGLAREVDPDQVLRRLDGMIKTVKISASKNPTATQENPTKTASAE
jgi:hypothetical protein